MTTILAYRETLYTDSRCTADNASFRSRKIQLINDNAIVACCGRSEIEREFYRQLRDVQHYSMLAMPDEFREDDGDADFAALMITKDGIYHFDSTFTPDWVDGLYFAVGSGQAAVLGAIEVQKLTPTIGPDPIRAMMAALKVDQQYSGGPIQWMRMGELELHKESV